MDLARALAAFLIGDMKEASGPASRMLLQGLLTTERGTRCAFMAARSKRPPT